MVLTQAYKEAMDHIAVTADMRSRILRSIGDLPSLPGTAGSRLLPARCLAAAACLALFLAGAAVLPSLLPSLQGERPSGTQAGVLEKTAVSSLSELSQAVGFEVDGLRDLPFPITETWYTAYGEELAEVRYVGETQSLTFRQAAGDADPSGDYTSYPDTVILKLGPVSAVLKGESGRYCLAVWRKGAYSYSIRADAALSDIQWSRILQSLG